jgi:3-deoxy-7-phosphoheptulonate synthase
MIVVTVPGIDEERIRAMLAHLDAGSEYTLLRDDSGRIIVSISCPVSEEAVLALEAYPWVEKVLPTEVPYHRVGRTGDQPGSVIQAGTVAVGGGSLVVMAGPCAVESYEQLKETALLVRQAGAVILRGGAYKPRTSPYAFQGLALEGLEMLQAVGKEIGMPVVSEIMDPRDVAHGTEHLDLIQIGARSMNNTPLLKEVGRQQKPVLLKRSPMATYEEWLQAAEYIAAAGNGNIILCERGIRTFETYTRNTLDLAAVPAIKQMSHLPIVVDPSHGTGRWRMVAPLAMAAVAAGADGLMVEVHPRPEMALSDGRQSLQPDRFKQLMHDLKKLVPALGRTLIQAGEGD